MALLSRLFVRRFSLPAFTPAAFEFRNENAHQPDELLLDRVVAAVEDQSNVIALARPLPTAGELRDSIERHLHSTRSGAPSKASPDPAEELRTALAQLRRSLR